MENKFFTFINPYLSFIDKGDLYRKPFSWLYALIAILNLIIPLYLFYMAIDNHIFDAPAKFVIVFILLWLIIAFTSWISFQLWWDRKAKIEETSVQGDEFLATPILSHLIQTIGEWLGTWIGIVGFSVALLSTIILGDDANYLSYFIDIPFFRSGFLFIVIMPIYGFLIIVIARFLAEQFRALSSIANNTNPKKSNKTAAEETQETLQISKPINDETKIKELKQLKELFDSGAITKEEFEQQKAQLL